MKRLAELTEVAEREMNSSVRGPKTEGHMTRSNYKSVLPFTVNQGDEPICNNRKNIIIQCNGISNGCYLNGP